MAETVVDGLPSVEDVEREIARHHRGASLLRAIVMQYFDDSCRKRHQDISAAKNKSGVAHAG